MRLQHGHDHIATQDDLAAVDDDDVGTVVTTDRSGARQVVADRLDVDTGDPFEIAQQRVVGDADGAINLKFIAYGDTRSYPASHDTVANGMVTTIRNITHDMHVRFCNIDYDREMAIVAEVRENGGRRLAGIGSFNIEADLKKCEFSVIVHDDFQGKGLAHKLVDTLIGIADDKRLEEFFGYIQPGNRKMVKLCEKLGMIRESTSDDLAKVRLLLR